MEFKEACKKCKKHYEKAKQHPKFWIIFCILLAIILLIWLPPWRVSHFEINNVTIEATLENQYRATLAQILGGVAIGISLYYTWRKIAIAEKDLQATQENLKVAQDNLTVTQDNLKVTQEIAQKNLKISQEGQITERFTRAIDQLGNEKMEIRLGGIYALERISKESEEDYWPIMEILTAYVRKNSSVEAVGNKKVTHIVMDIQANESTTNKVQEMSKVSLDIQAILTVIGRRKYSFTHGETNNLNLQMTYLEGADFLEANLKGASLYGADLKGAYLLGANLVGTNLVGTNLERADLFLANLEESYLEGANLKGANLNEANLKGANLNEANLKEADLEGTIFIRANLEGANLEESYLEGANLKGANLKGANLKGANLLEADLNGANLKGANLLKTDLEEVDLEEADLEEANLEEANLFGARLIGATNLTVDQLSAVKTLYEAELDEELLIILKEKFPAIFEKPNDDE